MVPATGLDCGARSLLRLQASWDTLCWSACPTQITKLTATLKRLDSKDSTRIELTDQLLNKWVLLAKARVMAASWGVRQALAWIGSGVGPSKLIDRGALPCLPWRRLYDMGVITTKKSLVQLEKLSTASFCRRRLSVVMVSSWPELSSPAAANSSPAAAVAAAAASRGIHGRGAGVSASRGCCRCCNCQLAVLQTAHTHTCLLLLDCRCGSR